MHDDHFQETPESSGPSKTQLKREMTALQQLGEELTTVDADTLEQCQLPQRLLDALDEFRRLPNKHGARRRQLQYIGKLMRELDEETLQRIDAQLHRNVDLEKKRFRELEDLRDSLLAGDKSELERLITEYPDFDAQLARQLIRQAHKERENSKPPASARKLFKLLREL